MEDILKEFEKFEKEVEAEVEKAKNLVKKIAVADIKGKDIKELEDLAEKIKATTKVVKATAELLEAYKELKEKMEVIKGEKKEETK